MRTRLFLAFAFAAAFVWTNAAPAGNIAHGVSVVVIDAGHGGSDPGAHYAGVYEKDLTLKVALRLGKLIEQQMPGVKVVYTRKTDKALASTKKEDLKARAAVANDAGGDLFISIHVNASTSSAARGVETIVMGETPLEQNYNRNALFENNRDDLIDMSDERTAAIVRAYIQNLQFTYGEYSLTLAHCIQNSYQKDKRHSRGVKRQPLMVLYATDMPGVLTEIGFLSNPAEAAYLKSEKGQNEIVQGLLRAVKEYSTRLSQLRGEVEAGAQAEANGSGGKQPAATDVNGSSKGERPTGSSSEPDAGKGTTKPAVKGDDRPVRYTVQVLASSKVVPLKSTRFKSYRGKVRQYLGAGSYCYKYCIGEFESVEAAKRKAAEVLEVFPDAYVVKCRGTQIVQ